MSFVTPARPKRYGRASSPCLLYSGRSRCRRGGDALRERDHAAIAASAVTRIAAKRADAQGVAFTAGKPVEPDGAPRAYIIDSLKHPAEAGLLRRLYGEAFVLIGVVCSPPVLRERLSNALFNGVERPLPKNIAALDEFISRDAGDPDKKHGQHVTDAFQEADFFVDNTKHVDMPGSGDFKDAIDQRLIGELDRLVSIILHTRILRPTVEESAMHAAYSAQLQSSCLSRQVGAALIDEHATWWPRARTRCRRPAAASTARTQA